MHFDHIDDVQVCVQCICLVRNPFEKDTLRWERALAGSLS